MKAVAGSVVVLCFGVDVVCVCQHCNMVLAAMELMLSVFLSSSSFPFFFPPLMRSQVAKIVNEKRTLRDTINATEGGDERAKADARREKKRLQVGFRVCTQCCC